MGQDGGWEEDQWMAKRHEREVPLDIIMQVV